MDRCRGLLAGAAAGLALLAAAGCAGNAATAAGTATGPANGVSRALPSPFSITARYTASSLGLDHPDALAIGPEGNLYATDASERVTVISPAGKVLRRWGKPGSGPGEFKFIAFDATTPTDVAGKIAVGSNGDVYVSDSGNGRVQVFTADGRFVRQFGSFGGGKGQFLRPFDIAADNAGNVYVVDDQAENVSKFSPSGKVIWQLGTASGPADLVGHLHFTMFDAHGRLVMVNDDIQKVVYVDASGHDVDAFTPDSAAFAGGNACEVTVDAAGDTYVSGCGPQPAGPTLVYDRAHRLIAKWPGTTYSLIRSPAFGPHGEIFALAADGSILKLHITLPGA
jgi:DNA-binding beta-propeller fold protein YncE